MLGVYGAIVHLGLGLFSTIEFNDRSHSKNAPTSLVGAFLRLVVNALRHHGRFSVGLPQFDDVASNLIALHDEPAYVTLNVITFVNSD